MTSYELDPIGGGGGQFAGKLARHLTANEDKVDLLTMGFSGLSSVETHGRLTIYRAPCIRRNLRYCSVPEATSYLLGALPLISKLLKTQQYNLVHTHFIFPDGLLGLYTALVYKLPYIITAHGTDVPNHNPHRVRMLHKILHPLWRIVTTKASCIVCPSELLRTKLKHANVTARTASIPNGFDPNRFEPSKPKANRLLVVTRLVETKGVQYILQALQGFRPDYEVVVVGDGPYREDLENLARQLDIPVKFVGWIENDSLELKFLYETSRIFLFPSEVENFPVVLLEAMAAGMSIITTQGTGCAEVVGNDAILVPPRDSAAIRKALNMLVSHLGLAEALGVAARARLERLFSWRTVIDRYREIYRNHARFI